MRTKLVVVAALFALIGASCGSSDTSSGNGDQADVQGTTETPVEEDHGPTRTIDAVSSDAIVVDGDSADWADIEGLDMTLEAISDEAVAPHEATVRIAHDADNVYMLFEVTDDYDWNADDGHLSAAAAIEWGIDATAEEHMGTKDADRDTSLGMVDIWHWELECGPGEQAGGAVSGPGEGNDAGNDVACNFDDEWATTPETREDDRAEGAENSLFGVWTHTASEIGADGTWTFEMQRPLDTGDSQDAQFAVGETAKLAVAYWDADNSVSGWKDAEHAQSANQGWIEVTFS